MVGSSILKEGKLFGVQIAVKQSHYFYGKRGHVPHDIALIKVNTTIALDWKRHNTSAVCLPQSYHNYTEPEYGLIAGWGVTTPIKGRESRHLQTAWVSIGMTTLNESDHYGEIIVIRRTPPITGSMPCTVSFTIILINSNRWSN